MKRQALHGNGVVAVFAHPDDESLACGGTLARLASQGLRVVVFSASHGERGATTGPQRDDRVGRTRASELRRAAEALGIAEVVIGDHPDGELRWAEVTELQAELVSYIQWHRPAAVITFGEDGLYWHPDHIGIYERTTAAVRALGSQAPPLYYVTMLPGVMTEIVAGARARGWVPPPTGFWSIVPEAFGAGAEPATISVDVSGWVPQKLAAILCHQSQMVDDHPFTRLPDATAARLLGTEYFHRADVPTSAPPLLERL